MRRGLFRRVMADFAVGMGLVTAMPVGAQVAPASQAMVPYRPIPPGGAAYAMDVPARRDDGQWATINTGLDAYSTLWHLRSAWNVAALNCLDPSQRQILTGYRAFLTRYSRPLATANLALETKFRSQYGAGAAIRNREAYMTRVYNYFALPATQGEFCATALAVASEYLAAPPGDAQAFAAAALPRYEGVFQDFFNRYAQYQADAAGWDAQYGALYGHTQPGYVAVHGGYAPPPPTGGERG
jgi:hypothetical protein